MNIKYTEEYLWPTKVGFFELGEPLEEELKQMYDFALTCSPLRSQGGEERRVWDILDVDKPFCNKVREAVVSCAKKYVGEEFWDQMTPVEVENRAIIMTDRSFINTHVDSREGHVTAVLWLTGNGGSHDPAGNGEGINTADGNPAFKVEDPSRYLDAQRLPWESRQSYKINPKAGLLAFFPSHVPHNAHPYIGDKPHIQIPIGFTFSSPIDVEQEPGEKISALEFTNDL